MAFSDLKLREKNAEVISNVRNYRYTWLEGSAQASKSVTAALAFALLIESAPAEDDLFIALGYTESSARNNVFSCGGFGLEAYFGNRCSVGKYKNIDALKIRTSTGMKYVLAFGTSTKTSNNKWHGFRVAGFLFDEIDRACEESITEMKQRIMAVKDPHIIVTMNPNAPDHPIYTMLSELEAKGLVNYKHFCLFDNPALTPEQVKKKMEEYDPESVFYKRYILGERVVAENLIYHVRDYNIVDEINPENYIEYIISCDQGETISSSAFVLLAMHEGFSSVDALKIYKHRNADKPNSPNFKFARDYAEDLALFVRDSIDLMNGVYPRFVYIDRSEAFYRECCLAFQKYELPITLLKYCIKDEISQRIQEGVNLLYRKRLRFHKDCEELIH